MSGWIAVVVDGACCPDRYTSTSLLVWLLWVVWLLWSLTVHAVLIDMLLHHCVYTNWHVIGHISMISCQLSKDNFDTSVRAQRFDFGSSSGLPPSSPRKGPREENNHRWDESTCHHYLPPSCLMTKTPKTQFLVLVVYRKEIWGTSELFCCHQWGCYNVRLPCQWGSDDVLSPNVYNCPINEVVMMCYHQMSIIALSMRLWWCVITKCL